MQNFYLKGALQKVQSIKQREKTTNQVVGQNQNISVDHDLRKLFSTQILEVLSFNWKEHVPEIFRIFSCVLPSRIRYKFVH